MRTPSAAEVLRIWELGSGKKGWYRALLLLAPVFPDATFGALADLTLGSRNTYLIRLRERLFGPTISALVTCETCRGKIEVTIGTSDLLSIALPEPRFAGDETHALATASGEVTYRFLSTRDLEAAGAANAIAEVGRVLVDRAVLSTPSQLDDTARELVADAIVSADPLADIRLGVECSTCKREWSMPLDIAAYLWSELEAEVARLLDQVHRIAAAYGWSEATILSMSRSRRREYLRRAP